MLLLTDRALKEPIDTDKKMKKIIKNITLCGLMVVGGGFALSSCEDYLTITPSSSIVEEDFWQDRNDLKNALMACYKRMVDNDLLRKYEYWGEERSDNVERSSSITSSGPVANIMNANLLPTYEQFNWTPMYNAINDCNKVLAHGPEVIEIDESFSQHDWKPIRAEVITLRALCHFYLVRTFGEIPYVTQDYNNDSQELRLPQSTQLAVLDSIITDLESIKNDAMIDYGTCSIEHVAPKSESHLDGIRVIFKKHLQDKALDFCRQIKEKGYKIFVNPVSVTTFSDKEMISLIEKINEIEPYAVTIVDTYGLMHSDKVLHYCNVMNKHLNKDIILGYHAHNNFQLAYSNTIAVMENIKDRDISIDATLFGMGKSAGNACTELVAMYMNERFGKHYDINQIQEAIDIDITKEFAKKEWGYRPLFYISALNECHPNYVTQLLEKKTLSVKQINEILSKLPKENDKNLLYDKEYCERLYQDFQNNTNQIVHAFLMLLEYLVYIP